MSNETTRQTKKHILDVAREHFFKKGYASSSINTIVAAASVTKPTVYYHFKNKEGLFAALVEEAYENCYEHRRRAVAETAPVAKQICQVISSDFAFCLEKPALVRFVLSLTFALPDEKSIDLKKIHYRDYQFFSAIIERGIKNGEISASEDVLSAALALQGIIAINIMSFLQMEHTPDFLSPERAKQVAKVFLDGIKTQPKPNSQKNRPNQ